MHPFAETTYLNRYAHVLENGEKENWTQVAWRAATHTFSAVDAPQSLVEEAAKEIEARRLMPGGRYLYACGLPVHQTNNCMLFRAEDSREGWASIADRAIMALTTGAGIGVVYSAIREEGAIIRGTNGIATGPIALMKIMNEIGREIMQGGTRRSAIWAGLRWDHPDIFKFIMLKNWSKAVREMKAKDFNFPATMDMTNISVILDDEFFDAYHNPEREKHTIAHNVYWITVKQMLKTSEPGFSVNIGENEGEDLRNACCEITTRDDNDICNLASPNIARHDAKQQFAKTCRLATAFCVAGSEYSDVPFEAVRAVREKNRRLGVGVMGLHEWLLLRGKKYGPDEELGEWLQSYKDQTEHAAKEWANYWHLSIPIKTRAIAPNGTIGIVAGPTTTGIEPVFEVAYLRRYLKGKEWNEQYVIEPVAQRLIDEGVDPKDIETSHTIDPERRIAFQAWVQQYVDHAISSTINIPAWGSKQNNSRTINPFGKMLMKYLPKLRGITCYADGSRSGQPLTPVPYEEALRNQPTLEAGDVCKITKGESCGD